MTAAPSTKQCRVCHKDVSHEKRVKDQQGNYYCQPCHDALAKKKAQASVAAATPVAVHSAPPKDDYDFAEPIPEHKPRVAVPVTTPPRAPETGNAKGVKIPEFCPNCNTKMLPGRRLCVKCNRDVTKMDKLLKIKAEEARGPSKEDKIAGMVAGLMKIAFILIAVGAVAFSLYGIYILFKPTSVWEAYPFSRQEAVKEYIEAIAQGTEKGDMRAYHLTSLRILQRSSNDNEPTFYKFAFKKLREDFAKKYGDNWISKVKIERVGDDDLAMDDEVYYAIKIDGDSYSIGTQVQIALQDMVGNMGTRHKQTYSEDGKNHFGITEMDDYPPHPREVKEFVPPPRTDNFGGNHF